VRYLRNTWYVAAWSDEVPEGKLLARTLLDDPVVLFRGASGQVAALADRCPHRFAPLSAGVWRDGQVQCRYHGLEFDGCGSCVRNPHGAVAASLAVRSWRVAEAHRAIWIWMGEAGKADASRIPDLSYLVAVRDTAFSRGYLVSKGSYEVFVDNILDLSHTDYLHPGTLGGGAMTRTRQRVSSDDRSIEVEWFCGDTTPAPLLVSLIPQMPAKTDFVTRVRWYPPAVMRLTAATVPAGQPIEQGFVNLNAHIFTPETATSTHYFFAATRNYCVDDAALNDRIAATRERIFATEDRPMIELIQQRMGSTEFWDLQPRLLAVDEAAVTVRRRLQQLIDAETGTTRQEAVNDGHH
jgi:vanillate O-demethylase monooxygenase subunit